MRLMIWGYPVVSLSKAPFPMLLPVMKKVALALYSARISRISDVKIYGPSSKVSATWFLFVQVYIPSPP